MQPPIAASGTNGQFNVSSPSPTGFFPGSTRTHKMLNTFTPTMSADADSSINKNNSDAFTSLTYGELRKLKFPSRYEVINGLARGEFGTLNAITNTGKTTLM